jgi:hypothetical protein
MVARGVQHLRRKAARQLSRSVDRTGKVVAHQRLDTAQCANAAVPAVIRQHLPGGGEFGGQLARGQGEFEHAAADRSTQRQRVVHDDTCGVEKVVFELADQGAVEQLLALLAQCSRGVGRCTRGVEPGMSVVPQSPGQYREIL